MFVIFFFKKQHKWAVMVYGKAYRPYLPEQELLRDDPSLRDGRPEGELVYFVSDVVDRLDLWAIEKV